MYKSPCMSDTVRLLICVCDEEGCGLLTDGYTSMQLTTWGYAVAVRIF